MMSLSCPLLFKGGSSSGRMGGSAEDSRGFQGMGSTSVYDAGVGIVSRQPDDGGGM